MILLNMPLKRNEVKAFIETLDLEGHRYTLKKEEGMRFYYEDNQEDEESGAKLLKKAIKGLLGPAYYFAVEVVK
ncbi:MAG: hypothetical protein LBR25_01550 [Erysipelotrichaceae bacterium]|jgi:hypothetical protein|nr:hypothetical protein [Erysipelotrichaceae bacterium]